MEICALKTPLEQASMWGLEYWGWDESWGISWDHCCCLGGW